MGTPCEHQVMVVEDDDDIREAIAAILEAEGYRVVVAEHGARALESLRSGAGGACLIILDLMMPVMDGWAFCAEKEKDPAIAAIPVVVVSAVARQDPNRECVRAVEHLTKPIALDRLLAVVAQHC